MKIVQAPEDSNSLLKRVTKIIKNETKEQKGGVLCMLLGTLGTSLIRNKEWGIRNKPWWTCRCRYTLDCFVL